MFCSKFISGVQLSTGHYIRLHRVRNLCFSKFIGSMSFVRKGDYIPDIITRYVYNYFDKNMTE